MKGDIFERTIDKTNKQENLKLYRKPLGFCSAKGGTPDPSHSLLRLASHFCQRVSDHKPSECRFGSILYSQCSRDNGTYK